MANFDTADPRLPLTGAGRLAFSDPALAVGSDPANVAAIISTSTWAFAAPTWADAGATDGGIQITKGREETFFSHDLLKNFRRAITSNSMAVSTGLVDTGDLETFRRAWVLGAVTLVTSPSTDRKMGLAAKRTVPRISAAIAVTDRAASSALARVFYLREVEVAAADSTVTFGVDAMHVLPISLVAFTNPAAATDMDFGFILENANFGGIANPA